MENTKENKYEWYGLSSEVRQNLVLELQEKGYTKEMLNDHFDVNSDRTITDFMNTRGYASRNGFFIKKEQIGNISSETNPAVKKKIEKLEDENKILLEKQKELLNMVDSYKEKEDRHLDQNNKMLDIIKDYQDKEKESQNQLVSLINSDKNQTERVLSIIEYYMAQTAMIKNNETAALCMVEESINESCIELVDTSMPIPKVDGEVKRTSIRVNEVIMAAFNKVWKSKYSEYKQHDLLNLALQDFIEKYK